jgi:hypothetical protein
MKQPYKISWLKRGLCLNAGLSLLLFAIFSPPHRVHHTFEQSSGSQALSGGAVHDDDGHGNHRHDDTPVPASKGTDCVVLHAAQSANGSLDASVELPNSPDPVDLTTLLSAQFVSFFSPSSCSQRAPPLI